MMHSRLLIASIAALMLAACSGGGSAVPQAAVNGADRQPSEVIGGISAYAVMVPRATVSGNVVIGGKPAAGVTVELRIGTAVAATATSDRRGDYVFFGVNYGMYTLFAAGVQEQTVHVQSATLTLGPISL